MEINLCRASYFHHVHLSAVIQTHAEPIGSVAQASLRFSSPSSEKQANHAHLNCRSDEQDQKSPLQGRARLIAVRDLSFVEAFTFNQSWIAKSAMVIIMYFSPTDLPSLQSDTSAIHSCWNRCVIVESFLSSFPFEILNDKFLFSIPTKGITATLECSSINHRSSCQRSKECPMPMSDSF